MLRPLNTLQAQRLVSIRHWGARDAHEANGRPFCVPVFLKDYRAQAAYVFGYQQEVRRIRAQTEESTYVG